MSIFVDKAKIKQLRLNRSWTQEKLAETSDINLRTVQRIEKDGVASLQSCKNIALALAVDPIDLIIDENQEVQAKPSPLIVPALVINCVVFILWGIAQFVINLNGLNAQESGRISFLFLFFAAIVLVTFLTPLAKRRIPIILACIVIATIMSPPDLVSSLLFALPLWLLSELSLYLAVRIRANTCTPG